MIRIMNHNNIKDLFVKIITTVSISAGLHGWYMTNVQMQTLNSSKLLLKSNDDCVNATELLKKAISQSDIRDSIVQTRLETLKVNFLDSKAELTECWNKISQGKDITFYKNKIVHLYDENLKNMDQINEILNIPKKEFETIVENGFKTAKETSDILNKNINENIYTDKVDQLTNSSISKDLDKALESNVFSPIVDTFNYTQELLKGLTLEQHACFVNGLAFFLVFLCLNSLVSAYFGNKLIHYFKLETRLPKLAKIIQYRIQFLNYYLITNIIILYFITIFFILVNLYFFLN